MKTRTYLASAAAILVSVGAMAAGNNGLTKTPSSMISGLSDGSTIQQNATTGALSVVPGGITGLNASAINAGTFAPAQLPPATSSAIGAVSTGSPSANQFLTGFSSGAAVYGQPSFPGIAGSVAPTQITAVAPYDFTGDGSTTAFTLGAAPTSAAKIVAVTVGGVYQTSSAWSLSGTTLTFAAAPPSGVAIEIKVGP